LSHACHIKYRGCPHYGTGASKENNMVATIRLKTVKSWRN
jgi:hypothetical protein